MNVHTHGPDEGRDIDCGETRLADGSPLGWCQILPVIRKAKAEAWQEGYRSGHSRAMRRMSDEPRVPHATNPYTEES